MFTYKDVLNDVYGITEFIRPLSAAGATSSEGLSFYNSAADLRFIVIKESPCSWSVDEQELFEKIMTALKKNPQQYYLQVVSDLKSISTKPGTWVVMSDNPQKWTQELQNLNTSDIKWFSTWDPTSMINSPDLKKEAWSLLQSLKQ